MELYGISFSREHYLWTVHLLCLKLSKKIIKKKSRTLKHNSNGPEPILNNLSLRKFKYSMGKYRTNSVIFRINPFTFLQIQLLSGQIQIYSRVFFILTINQVLLMTTPVIFKAHAGIIRKNQVIFEASSY